MMAKERDREEGRDSCWDSRDELIPDREHLFHMIKATQGETDGELYV